jgi:hypothetical protein
VQPRQKKSIRFLFLSTALALCGLASWQGLVTARNSGDSEWTLIFGFVCLFLLLATVQSVALPLIRRLENSPHKTAGDSAQHGLDHGEYIAKFSTQDRAVALILLGAFMVITAYLFIHPAPLYMRCVSVGMLTILLWITCRVSFTIVRFTSTQITVRIFPFGLYSESYSDVASLSAQPGNLQIRFGDGKSLNMWAGLGDAAKIAAILERRVEVLPKVADWRGPSAKERDSGTCERK